MYKRQAGLSWITILKKREGYRKAFCNFDAGQVAQMTYQDVVRLMQFEGIVRNRLKIKSTITNARLFLAVQKVFGSFYNYTLSFFHDGKPIVNLSLIHILSKYTVDLAKMGSVRCSPLINPLLLSYSKSNGFSYRQEFKYNRLFKGDRLLRIVPKLGYNFKPVSYTHLDVYKRQVLSCI